MPIKRMSMPHLLIRLRIGALTLSSLLLTATVTVSVQAAGYDPDALFPEREGWVLLRAAPDWVNKRRVITPPKRANAMQAASREGRPDSDSIPDSTPGVPLDAERPAAGIAALQNASGPALTQASVAAAVEPVSGPTESRDGASPPSDIGAGAAMGAASSLVSDPPSDQAGGKAPSATTSGQTSPTAAPDEPALVSGVRATDGVVAVVGSGDNQQAVRKAGADQEDAADEDKPGPALAGVRYRILDAGDPSPPSRRNIGDQAHAYIRATAKDLAGNPVGPEGRADDEDANGVRKLEWEQMPKALALAVRQMPYNARWEVFIPNSSRAAGKGGAYRILRSRPLIFDVQRMAPG